MRDVGPRFLLEREREIISLTSTLNTIGDGGGAVVVTGDPGIGKTVLLDAVAELSRRRGLQTVSAAGVQSEAQLPFAALQQLLRPLDRHLGALRPAQAAAVRTAIGRADGPAGDVYSVALAVLDLLAEAAAAQPLVVIVDDAHWVDEATERVLAFVARRLGHDPVVLITAIRHGHRSLLYEVGLPLLHLSALSDGAASELLGERHPELTTGEREAVRRLAIGNPLALLELPRSHSYAHNPDDLSGAGAGAPELTARLMRSFAARLTEFHRDTRWALLVAAADVAAELTELAAAIGRALLRTNDVVGLLRPAVEGGLVQIDDRGIHFLHPLVRHAVYQSASAPERRTAHAALAAVLTSRPERRAWHLAAAGSGPDESVARQLEHAAGAAERRGAPAASASAWQRAAWFSADDASRGARLLRAAELRIDAGDVDAASALLARAAPLLDDLLDVARAALVRHIVSVPGPGDTGQLRELCDLAVRVSAERGGADVSARLLLAAARQAWATDPGRAARAAVMAAAGRLPIPTDDARRLSIAGYADPTGYESAISDRMDRMNADDLGEHEAELVMSVYLVGDSRIAPLQRVVVGAARTGGRMLELPRLLTVQAWTAIATADWQLALTGLTEAIELADETRQPLWMASAMTGRAMVDAVRGEAAAADLEIAEVEAMILPQRANPVLCGLQLVRGVSAIAAGRFDTAYTQLRRLFDADDPAHHPVQSLWALGDFVEAATRSGHLEDARQVVGRVRPADGHAVSPWTRAALQYIRPLLADAESVEREYRAALNSELRRWPVYHARLTLQFGQWLRHERRINESRAPLRAAREACDAFGLAPWADRARQELRATGEVSVATIPPTWTSLSPQELQIARLAAEGMSNREIGQQLFLSHRTIGSHLYRLFPKLGVTSRAQLRDALMSDFEAER